MSFDAIIPARYASTRLPGKPLADIGGKPMVVRVAERASASGARGVWVATDHREIAAAVRAHGFEALMTRSDHPSGTDRIAEAAELIGLADDKVVVNVQGDEPLIEPALIARVAAALRPPESAAIATASHPIESAREFFDPNVVKVVCDEGGRALYFSRAPIPFARDAFRGDLWSRDASSASPFPAGLPAHRHVGLYAFRVGFLKRFAALEAPPIERFEALEQLRALWHGYSIRVIPCGSAPQAGIDTLEDLARVRKKFDE